jgi:hypothetical protein
LLSWYVYLFTLLLDERRPQKKEKQAKGSRKEGPGHPRWQKIEEVRVVVVVVFGASVCFVCSFEHGASRDMVPRLFCLWQEVTHKVRALAIKKLLGKLVSGAELVLLFLVFLIY